MSANCIIKAVISTFVALLFIAVKLRGDALPARARIGRQMNTHLSVAQPRKIFKEEAP